MRHADCKRRILQVNWDKELDEEAERQRKRKKDSQKPTTSQTALPPVKKPEVVPQIPKPRSSVSPKPNRSVPLPTATNSATLDLLGLGESKFDKHCMRTYIRRKRLRAFQQIRNLYAKQMPQKIKPVQMALHLEMTYSVRSCRRHLHHRHLCQMEHRRRVTVQMPLLRPASPKRRAFSINRHQRHRKRVK